ncbi:MAG: hypothetical protein WA003_08635 [Desulfuromonadaceae bacterium]
MALTSDEQFAIDERARIMEFDGHLSRIEAERLARTRPWEKDHCWMLPEPQMNLIDDTPAGSALRQVMGLGE